MSEYVSLSFKESAAMSEKIVRATLHIYAIGSIDMEGIILERFEQLVKHAESDANSADKLDEYFNECLGLIENAIQISSALRDCRTDRFGNSSRWVKVIDGIAVNGQARSALVVNGYGTLSTLECELHNWRWREDALKYSVDLEAVSITVQPDGKVNRSEFASQLVDKDFHQSVFSGLEILGYLTPPV